MNFKRSVITAGICLVMTSAAIAAPQNLVKNGAFEEAKNNVPTNWQIGDLPGVTDVSFPKEKEQGTVAQIRFLKWDGHAASFSQNIDVKPHTNYRLTLKARMNMGNMRIAVSGGKDDGKVDVTEYGRAAHYSMYPSFWDEAWSKYLIFVPNQWRSVTIDFNSGNATSVTVSLGGYQRAGTYAFDDVSLTAINK